MTNHEQIRALVNTTLVRPHMNAVIEWLRARPGSVCIDIGANLGGMTREFIKNGAMEIHAFEPVPANFIKLMENCGSINGVTLNQAGVSDVCGWVRGARILNAHTLADPAKVNLDVALEDTGAFNFETITIDSYMDVMRVDSLDLIKLDVDGYEPQCVRGMIKTLQRYRPMLMIELSYLPMKLGESVERMVSQIYDLGYKLCTMDNEVCEDALMVMEAFPWRTSFDMVAIPNEQISPNWTRIR